MNFGVQFSYIMYIYKLLLGRRLIFSGGLKLCEATDYNLQWMTFHHWVMILGYTCITNLIY